MNKWISVKDELPAIDKWVNLRVIDNLAPKEGFPDCGYMETDTHPEGKPRWATNSGYEIVTHWSDSIPPSPGK